MKTKSILFGLSLFFSLTVSAQQIGDGNAKEITNFNTGLASGFYKTNKAQVNFPHEIATWPWKHLINLKGDAGAPCLLQISSAYTHDDRMFFRKVVMDGNNPNATNEWHELATRGNNTITGETYYEGEGQKISMGSGSNKFSMSYYGTDTYIGYPNNLFIKNNSLGNDGYIIFSKNGNVGIGTFDSTYKLNVSGTIRAKEVRVESDWADFVFAKDYVLPTLDEVKTHIDEHKHLPGIPSEAEVKENGVGLAEITTKLLQKVEELTLYVIQQNNRIQELEKSKE